MPNPRGLRRLILRCRLCDPDGLLVEPTCERSVPAAVDHALDLHRDELLTNPDHVLSALSVSA